MRINDHQALESQAQLSYLRSVTEIRGSTPVAALFNTCCCSVPGAFSFTNKIKIEQKYTLDKDPDDPVHAVYKEQLKYNFEKNWANHTSQLQFI